MLGTSFGAKLEKQNKDGEMQPSYYFYAYHCVGNPLAVSLKLNGLLKMWKIHQAKQTMKYADDTLLYFASDDVNIIESNLSSDLDSVTQWLSANYIKYSTLSNLK